MNHYHPLPILCLSLIQVAARTLTSKIMLAALHNELYLYTVVHLHPPVIPVIGCSNDILPRQLVRIR